MLEKKTGSAAKGRARYVSIFFSETLLSDRNKNKNKNQDFVN